MTRTVHPHRGQATVVNTEDAVAIIFETQSGVIGSLLISQVSAGRKNRLSFEIGGELESYFFDQENPDSLWIGETAGFFNKVRDPRTLHADAAKYSVLPAGHPQGYHDAFDAFVRDTYSSRRGQRADGLPTFADGYRAAVLTEAVLSSHRSQQWIETPADLLTAQLLPNFHTN